MNVRPLLLGAVLAFGGAAGVSATEPTAAEKQGQALVAELRAVSPTENYTQTGILKMRDRARHWIQIPFRLEIGAAATNRSVNVVITDPALAGMVTNSLKGAQASTAIAGSDFQIGDLAMEFLNWPEQRVLKREMRRGRACKVLESVNPDPGPGRYHRVLTWIDSESSGIIQAEAYDEHNKLLKEFEVKDLQKVNGHWEVKEMRIRNVQTGTQTLMQFDLGETLAPAPRH